MMINVGDCHIHASVTGREDAPTLMLSNSLGATEEMWNRQLAPFAREFRVVRYDRRGHGKSEVPSGPYSLDRLGRDALAIMDALELPKVHWCGLSMGGMVGQWLAANAPERIDHLILSNTTAYPNRAAMEDRIRAVREGGIEAIIDRVMEGWFTADFRQNHPMIVAWVRGMVLATPRAGYIANCEAIREIDLRDLLARITHPTLVIAGRYDPGIPIEAADFLRRNIAKASLTIIDAAHLSNVEQADAYTDLVLGFLTGR
jgi:3-oxoadipate enol-lactonase